MSEGWTEITSASRIVYTQAEASDLATILRSDLDRLFGLKLELISSGSPEAGDIFLDLDKGFAAKAEEYELKSLKGIHLKAAQMDGLQAASVTMLQALSQVEGKVSMPALSIKDHPSSAFRAHMIDVKNQWHSIDDLKKFVDLCRWYKVRYISLHTGEDQWIGALLSQTGKMTAEERKKHRLYSKEEMDGLIAYGHERGVYFLPHNECTPSFNHMKNAMQKDYNPSDDFAGFPDELDGKGSYADFTGKAEDRWLKLMEISIDQAIEQFSAGYPDGKLPYYHVGPVFGEGGMNSELAAKILKMITKKSPETKMMFWNGPNAKDSHLGPLKEQCVVAYYDDEFGASPMESYLKEGWPVVNSAWSPLYVVGSKLARPVEKVYSDWNLMRQGSDGIPGGYGAVTWEQVADEELGSKILGGMLTTWETPLKYHLERVRLRVPAMGEHAWNYQKWPYPAESYAKFEKRLTASNRALSKYLGEAAEKPLAPEFVVATMGTAKGKVKLEWRNGGGQVSPIGFRVMRSEGKNRAKGKQVSPDLPPTVERFVDSSVEQGVEYFYWVVAFNEAGSSEGSDFVSGSAGTGIANINSYEPFDYKKGDPGENGVGWKGPWDFKRGETFTFQEEGLSYEGLESSGGAIRMQPKAEKQGGSVVREITGRIGLDETTMWMSYLIRPSKVGIGDVFVVPNANEPAAIGKVWGDDFSIYMAHSKVKMKANQTYFVVARYEFGEGDKIAMWINPPLDKKPDLAGADLTATAEIGSGNVIRLQMQGYGFGDYLVDELRLGSSWKSVGGLVNADDRVPPNPSPMTWIGPPSQQNDGSIFMICIEAEDPSGVEYLFECVETKETSGWQESNEYRVKGKKPGTHTYRVKARDQSANRNETEWSFAGKVTVK